MTEDLKKWENVTQRQEKKSKRKQPWDDPDTKFCRDDIKVSIYYIPLHKWQFDNN